MRYYEAEDKEEKIDAELDRISDLNAKISDLGGKETKTPEEEDKINAQIDGLLADIDVAESKLDELEKKEEGKIMKNLKKIIVERDNKELHLKKGQTIYVELKEEQNISKYRVQAFMLTDGGLDYNDYDNIAYEYGEEASEYIKELVENSETIEVNVSAIYTTWIKLGEVQKMGHILKGYLPEIYNENKHYSYYAIYERYSERGELKNVDIVFSDDIDIYNHLY